MAAIQADPERVALLRRRLASLSWLMGSLCEPIARRANREDRCTGRFWEGRFKSQAIVDEAALLACSIYVDLNPIRACVAETPETSEFTAAFERIAARREASPVVADSALVEENVVATEPPPAPARNAWLSPVPDADVPREAKKPSPKAAGHRASDRGFLPLTLDEYLQLLDWTGRAVRADKRGAVPADGNLFTVRAKLHAAAAPSIWRAAQATSASA